MSDGYNTIVHDLPRFLVNYAHAQTVDTKPTFRRGGRGLGTRLSSDTKGSDTKGTIYSLGLKYGSHHKIQRQEVYAGEMKLYVR